MRKTTGRNATAHDKWHQKLWVSVRFIKEHNIYVACLWHIIIDIPMKHATNNKSMWFFQRCKRCSFLTQSSINFGVKKRQSWYKMDVPTSSVLRFLSAIRHESPRYNHTFSKKAQHRWRWISLQILTRGRLVPRQPRAIKRTTPTALHHEYIHNGKFVHWNNSAIPTALHRYNIHYAKYIHRQTIITQMALVTNENYLVWGLIGNNEPVDIKQENNMTQTTG